MAWIQLTPVASFQWNKYYGVIVIDLLVVGRQVSGPGCRRYFAEAVSLPVDPIDAE